MEILSKVQDKLLEALDIGNTDILLFHLIIVPLAFLAELCIVGWNKSSARKILGFKNTIKTDVFFLFIEMFNLFSIISIFLSFGACHFFAWLIYRATNFDLIFHIENPAVQFGLIYLISDFKGYWSHRLFHYYNTLWTLHEFHHAATDFCILTRFRGHFLESALKRFVDVIPYAIFGAPIASYFVVRIIAEFHQLAVHSSIEAKWGFIGKYILVSPNAHRIHHSVKREHYGRNFGINFIFWDRMFGTYQEVDKVEAVGVINNEYNKNGIFSDILLGLTNFYSSLKVDVKRLFSK